MLRTYKDIRSTASRRDVLRGATVLAAAMATGSIPSPASAQTYPAKPLTLIVPYAAGGPNDLIARVIKEHLEPAIGQSVMVDNISGAGGALGARAAAAAAPDGYTLLLSNFGIMVTEAFSRAPGYSMADDFNSLIHLASQTIVVAAGPKPPFGTVAELVAYAKAGNAVTIASAAPPQAEYLKAALGIDMAIVPVRGTAQALLAIASGETTLALLTLSDAQAQVEAGAIKAIAVCSQQKVAALPGVEAVAESVPGFVMDTWYGVAVPAKTPDEIVAPLRAALGDMARTEAFQAAIRRQGLTLPAAFEPLQPRVVEELSKWKALIETYNLPRN